VGGPEPGDRGVVGLLVCRDDARTPQRTVRDWRRLNRGPRYWRFNGNGRLYTTVAELRRFLEPGE
jgi:hypothetical protein